VYRKEQVEAGRDPKEEKETIMAETKENWANMTQDEKDVHQPPELSEEEKAKRE
jgi:hypothetical protein